MQNKIIYGYTLLRKLGEGGMAEVWYAENTIGKSAAVKILSKKLCDDKSIIDRFENEAKIMVKLRHPNIRQVYDYGVIEGRSCIIMEYLEGEDLNTLIQRNTIFTQSQVEKWWNQMVSALNYTHHQGIVHRDIKPSNIFITKDGNVELLDFGIAKITDSSLTTNTGLGMGTPMYMSPEQVIKGSKCVDYKSDIYSLAVTFVHLLQGKTPYSSELSLYSLNKTIVEEPLDLNGIPLLWRNFLTLYLAKNPEERAILKEFNMANDSDVVNNTSIDKTLIDTKKGIEQIYKQKLHNSKSLDRQVNSPTVILHNKKKRNVIGIISIFVTIMLIAGAIYLNRRVKNNETIVSIENVEDSLERIKPINKNKTITVNGIPFNMIYIESGEFMMGTLKEHIVNDYHDEGPSHKVILSNYYIGQYEVTQDLWESVMVTNPSRFKGENLPVERVTWYDAKAFIKKLNEITGLKFRLPTEAEWEFAARGGNSSMGYMYSGGNIIDDVAWYGDEENGKTHPVGLKSPNELGLYDMSGNVREWCEDGYSSDYYSKSPLNNPKGEVSPDYRHYRITRGGGWATMNSLECNVYYRNPYTIDVGSSNGGFRLALDVPENRLTNTIDSVEYTNGLTMDSNKNNIIVYEDRVKKIISFDNIAYELNYIEGGDFMMGSTDKDKWAEIPIHKVTVSDFFIGTVEINQNIWKYIMGNNPSYFKGDNLPVDCVTWYDVQKFITKLNELSGMNFRLPTEAEWEYAARGGKRSKKYKYSGSNDLANVAWTVYNSGRTTHPVGMNHPNELGLYDMNGNVWEWCSDWSDDYTEAECYNPKGPKNGWQKVIRGGGYGSDSTNCCVSTRWFFMPEHGYDGNMLMGFRLALSSKEL